VSLVAAYLQFNSSLQLQASAWLKLVTTIAPN
jgi:hypothetical protein